MLAMGSSGLAMILQAAGRMPPLSWLLPKASDRGSLCFLWGKKKKKKTKSSCSTGLPMVVLHVFLPHDIGFIMRLTFSLGSVFLLSGTCFMPLCHLDLWQLKSCWPGLCSVFVGEKLLSWSWSILSVKAKSNVHMGEVSYCLLSSHSGFLMIIFFFLQK